MFLYIAPMGQAEPHCAIVERIDVMFEKGLD
jgi:hypothetical protein